MNFLGIGPMELVLILVLALIVLGPEKLPEVMAQVGKAINEFRKATTQLTDEFNRTVQANLNDARSVVEETREALGEARSTVDQALAAPLGPPSTAPEARAGEPATTTATPNTSDSDAPSAFQTATEWQWDAAQPAPNGVHAGPDETATTGQGRDRRIPVSPNGSSSSSADGPSASDLLPPY